MTIRTIAAIAVTMLMTGTASAASFVFDGSFRKDNSKASFSFFLRDASTVTLRSLGYAGGTSSSGTTVARGGFDSYLSLYDASGALIGENDDGFNAPLDAVTNQGADAFVSRLLSAGHYTVFLTQYENVGPLTLPGAFRFDTEPNFANGFVDFYSDTRTGSFALDISGVTNAAVVPEPASWAMLVSGFGLVGAAMRRRGQVAA